MSTPADISSSVINRGNSPASSIGTVYPEDETSFSDQPEQTTQADFEAKWEAKIGIHNPMQEEIDANKNPLVFPVGFVASPNEEQTMYRKVMDTLRRRVRELEENEQFEQILLRGSQVGLQQQADTANVDAIMRGMMNKEQEKTENNPLADGPWNQRQQDADWDIEQSFPVQQ